MSFAEYSEYDGLGLAGLVRRGEVSAPELVEAAIERIERRNDALNAVVFKAYDEARTAAGGDLPDGPFRGVPFLVKDHDVAVGGWPTTHGSRFLRDNIEPADSGLVRRFRESGVVLVGKTNAPTVALEPWFKSSRGRRSLARAPGRRRGGVIAKRQKALVEHVADVDRFAAALAAHLQHPAHRRRPCDQIVELWNLQHRELAQPLVRRLIA